MNVGSKALVSIRDLRLCCKGREHWVDMPLNLGCLEHTRSESEQQPSLLVGRRVNTSGNSWLSFTLGFHY